MKWTKEKPTIAGKYWHKSFENDERELWMILDFNDQEGFKKWGGWWSSEPIPEPTEASD